MIKRIFSTLSIILTFGLSYAQKSDPDAAFKAIHKLFEQMQYPKKDSLVIYALNFEVTITKLNGKTKVINIEANDSLAYSILPNYKKLSSIDYSSLMGAKSKMRLVIPILIHGSSLEKMIYKDKEGNPLISLNAAVNAAYSLYNPIKYNNNRDAEVPLGHRLYKKSGKNSRLWEVTIMEPIIVNITNDK